MIEQFETKAIRRFLVDYQGLQTRIPRERLGDFFARVGSIQFDPLNVVGRNPDLVLQARVAGYRATELERLLYVDRCLIDGWDKMMSIYPITDWPRLAPLRAYKDAESRGVLAWRGSLEALERVGDVIAFLRDQGPAPASALDLGGTGARRWGHRRLSGATLDYLFNVGRVGVSRKKGAQKVYDLIERLIPGELLERGGGFVDEDAYHDWFILRRVGSIGLLWNRNGVLWQSVGDALHDKTYRESRFRSLVDEGRLVEIAVDGVGDGLYLRAENLEALRSAAADANRPRREEALAGATARFIAPLDNLLWDRDLVEALFNFRYRWEVYTPAAKREFGYYVLPILYGENLVGRFEPEFDKRANEWRMKKLWLEPGFRSDESFLDALQAEMREFSLYLGAQWVGQLPTD